MVNYRLIKTRMPTDGSSLHGDLLRVAAASGTDDVYATDVYRRHDGLVRIDSEGRNGLSADVEDAHVSLLAQRRRDADLTLAHAERQSTLSDVTLRRVWVITNGERRVVVVDRFSI